MGYPIVEVYANGSFEVTKPPETGGVVTVHSITEQMLYEVLDPSNYYLPDVILDITNVRVSQLGKNRVFVENVHGKPPSSFFKVSGTFVDGYKIEGQLVIGGHEASIKVSTYILLAISF
jgi:hypothetical protein